MQGLKVGDEVRLTKTGEGRYGASYGYDSETFAKAKERNNMRTVSGIFEVIETHEFNGSKTIARYEDRLDAFERAVEHMKSGICNGAISVNEVHVYRKEKK